MNKPQDFKTIARLVAEFQRPYHVIKAAFDAAGVVPRYAIERDRHTTRNLA